MEFLLILTFWVVLYIAYKLYQLEKRLTILDLRARVMEIFIQNPQWASRFDTRYQEIYKEVFENTYFKSYDKLVQFGRKNDLNLPLKTTDEDIKRKEKEEKAKIST